MFVEECNTVRFGNVARVIHGFPFKSELYAPDDGLSPRVVSIGNFDYSGGFRIGGDWKVYKGHYPSNYDLNPGDVLLVMTCQTEGGEILGIPATIPDDGRSYLHNQRLGRIQMVRPDCADLRFLYWVCLTPAFNDELCASASGTKIQHTAPSRIESFEFQLPDLESQRRIATALDALDSRIALNEKLNEALEATAAAVFKSWFVDFDPVVAKSEGRKPFGMTDEIAALFPDRFAPNGLPEGWKQESIYSIATVQYGAPYKSDRFNAERRGLPLIRIRDLPNQGSDIYTDEVHARDVIISPGDLVVGMDGEFRAYLWGGELSRMNQRVCKFVPHNQKDRCFVWETIKPQLWDIESTEVATTVIHLGKGDIDGFRVTQAGEPLRKAFSNIAEPLLDRVILNEKQNRALRNLRDAILPGLVSGELQIKDVQHEVAGAVG